MFHSPLFHSSTIISDEGFRVVLVERFRLNYLEKDECIAVSLEYESAQNELVLFHNSIRRLSDGSLIQLEGSTDERVILNLIRALQWRGSIVKWSQGEHKRLAIFRASSLTGYRGVYRGRRKMCRTHFWRKDIIDSDEGFRVIATTRFSVRYEEGKLCGSIDAERLPGQILLYGLAESDLSGDGTLGKVGADSRLRIARNIIRALQASGLAVEIQPPLSTKVANAQSY